MQRDRRKKIQKTNNKYLIMLIAQVFLCQPPDIPATTTIKLHCHCLYLRNILHNNKRANIEVKQPSSCHCSFTLPKINNWRGHD